MNIVGNEIFDGITGAKEAIIQDGKIFSAITGRQIGVVNGDIPGGGDIQLPETDFAAADLRSGKKAVNGNGNLVTGSMPDVQLSRNKNVVSIGQGYSSGGSATIPVVALSQDGNTVSIKEGYTRGGSVTVQSSGGGSFAKVTAFSPAVDAYTAAASIQVSGFGEVDGEDFSAWNGTYDCTNLYETTTENRIFKHKTDTKYLYYGVDEDEGGYPFWGFYRNTDYISRYSAVFYSYTLASGNWQNYEMGFSAAITIVKNDVEYPAQELVLNAVKATFENGNWTIGSAVTLTGYEKELIADGIYLLNDDKLIGDAITFDFEKWMPTDGLLCYFPMTKDGFDRVSGIRTIVDKAISFTENGAVNTAKKSGIKGFAAFDFPAQFTMTARVTVDEPDFRDDIGAIFDFGFIGDDVGVGLIVDTSRQRIGYHYDSGHSPYDGWGGLCFDIEYGREYVVTLTYDGTYIRMYKDGSKIQGDDERTFKHSANISFFSNRGRVGFSGTIADVMLWNRVLSDEEIATLVKNE